MAELIEHKFDGVIMVSGSRRLQNGIWYLVKTRKCFECALSGEPISKGVTAYKPMGNGMKRMQRILPSHIFNAIAKAKGE